MFHSIKCLRLDRRAFTLTELLINTFIVCYVIFAAWSVYVMVWLWWYEMAPAIEAQRVARVALTRVVTGMREDALGSDLISPTTYRRRNGIAEIALTNANPAPASPVITSSGGQDTIAFRLEPDVTNTRSYSVKTVSQGVQAMYYNNAIIPSTRIVGRIFLTCQPEAGFTNLYKVTVRVEKDVSGTRAGNFVAAAEFSDFLFMRNI